MLLETTMGRPNLVFVGSGRYSEEMAHRDLKAEQQVRWEVGRERNIRFTGINL